MAVAEYKAVAVGPFGVGSVVLDELAPQDVRHRSIAHRGTGVAAVGSLNHISSENANSVDALATMMNVKVLKFAG